MTFAVTEKGEKMNDIISRQAAIDALGDKPLAWTEGEYELGLQQQWEADVNAIKALSSAQQWIPCSERLPEIGQSVLLSVGGMYSAEGCLREDGDWAQFRWDAIQRKDMVGAWKPLPEPYKGEQE